ncbi:MAG: lactonase family protein [Bacteroidia bacterium]|nr:lactonase family protein [Bacteroidia bacterium]
MSTTSAAPDDYWLYLSSGSQDGGEGIGLYRFSADSGSVTPVQNLPLVESSSYLAVRGDRLYSIQEEGKMGLVTGFSLDAHTGLLSKLGEAPTGGVNPCYVALADEGRKLLVAHYTSAQISAIEIDANGAPGAMLDQVQHEGSSINANRQQEAHPHMIYPVGDANLILVPDLGSDQVFAYGLDEGGHFVAKSPASLHANPGAGPRHVCIHPTKSLGYWVNELDNTVNTFSWNAESGLIAMLDTVTILPQDFTDHSQASDIHISPDGRFVYAANRGHNSIAILAVEEATGTLRFVDTVPCGGDWPRAFAIDPTGKFLLVAQQHSDALTVFRRDLETGGLTALQTIDTEASPQCIRFVKVK